VTTINETETEIEENPLEANVTAIFEPSSEPEIAEEQKTNYTTASVSISNATELSSTDLSANRNKTVSISIKGDGINQEDEIIQNWNGDKIKEIIIITEKPN